MPGTSFYSAVKTVKRKEYSNHCEMAVKKALEALDGVEKAMVKAVPEAEIKKAVEDKDYKFVGIEG